MTTNNRLGGLRVEKPGLLFLAMAFALTLARVLALVLSDVDLGPDETQYWFWAQHPEWGYFSKPPLIAWIIAATTSVFGDAPWAVRIAAPFLHAGTAGVLYALGAIIDSERPIEKSWVGFWAGSIWLTAPGVMLASLIISTDTPLLFFWAVGLLCFFKLADPDAPRERAWRLAILLGAAIGAGMLAKYAAIYFVIGAGLAVITTRARIRPIDAAIAVGAALALIAPNLLWNAGNGFQTVSHTAANANWSGELLNPVALAVFLVGQLAVFGPITLALLTIAAVQFGKTPPHSSVRPWVGRALLAFIAPPIIIISLQSFISRAHANWAAAAFPAAAVLVALWAVRTQRQRWLAAGVAINLAIGVVGMIASTNFALIDQSGAGDLIKRVRGWEAQGAEIAARAGAYDAMVADDREVIGALVYYARSAQKTVFALNSNNRIDHHFEAFYPAPSEAKGPLLYVTTRVDGLGAKSKYRSVRSIGAARAVLADGEIRTLYLFEIAEPLFTVP